RISNTDGAMIAETRAALALLGFSCTIESPQREIGRPLQVVRLLGGLAEHLRFFHTVEPAITRKRDIEHAALKGKARLKVTAIEPLDFQTLFDITSETGHFIANSVVSHDCFGRPTHGYLGLSSGLG